MAGATGAVLAGGGLASRARAQGGQRDVWERSYRRTLAAINNEDGRLEAFHLFDDRVRHAWQVRPNDVWTGWSPLSNSPRLDELAVARNADGRLEVFGIGKGVSQLYHAWQVTPNGGWTRWERLRQGVGNARVDGDGSTGSKLAAARTADGRLAVFVVTTTGVRVTTQSAPNSGPWTGWTRLGGPLAGVKTVAVARGGDGYLHAYALVTQRRSDWLVSTRQFDLGWSPFGWGAQARFPGAGFARELALGVDSDGAVRPFVTTSLGTYTPGHGLDPGLGGTDGRHNRVAVARNADGRLECFTVTLPSNADGLDVYHTWQRDSPADEWTETTTLGSTSALEVTVAPNADGRLEAFIVGFGPPTEGGVWHTWQTRSGPWSVEQRGWTKI
jgi:hypothetical protein